MKFLEVEGQAPLMGTVTIAGSKNLAIKLIYAAMYSNDDVVLQNVPGESVLKDDLDVVKSVGATVEWRDENTLLLNGSTINSYKVPLQAGNRSRTALLFAGPLLFRFGSASIPKVKSASFKASPVNRLLEGWISLGVSNKADKDYYLLSSEKMKPANISFRSATLMGTDSAVLTALATSGETFIHNASEDVEVDSLIDFLKVIGADVVRTDPGKIKVTGGNIFKGSTYRLGFDRVSAANFIVGALITKGNITLKGVDREPITSFLHFLMKVGAKFEFSDTELKVWCSGESLESTSVSIGPPPGLLPDWQPLIVLLLALAPGESLVHDTVYVDRFGYVKDLNRMGASIDLVKPSEVGLDAIVNEDHYSMEKRGEPTTVAKIAGHAKLKGFKANIDDMRHGAVLVLAALAAEGKSQISGHEKIEESFVNFYNDLKSLGAKINVSNN